MRRGFTGNFLPKDFARSAVNANDSEPIRLVGRVSLAWFRSSVSRGNGRNQEHTVGPNDGSGVAFAWHGKLPLYVVGFAPVQRRGSMRCHTGGERAAPLWP